MTKKEMRDLDTEENKLLMVPVLREIIETGELGEEVFLKYPRKDGIVSFVPITQMVNFKGENVMVEVLVGRDKNGNSSYELYNDAGEINIKIYGIE